MVFNDNHLFNISEVKDFLIITSVGFLKEGSLINLRQDLFESKWMGKKEIISLNKELFVPKIKELCVKGFDMVMKYL